MHVRQTVVPSLMPVDQSFMIEPQQVEHRGVQVVHADGVLDDVV